MYEASNATQLAIQINVPDAILWIKSSWDIVQKTTIQKCFSHCGIDKDLFSGVPVDEDDLPLFAIIQDEDTNEDDLPLSSLLGVVTMESFTDCDRGIATFATIDDATWEIDLLRKARGEEDIFEEPSDDEDETESQEPVVITCTEAAKMIEELQTYSLASNQVELLEHIMISREIINKRLFLENNKNKQSTLDSWFIPRP